jgi:hypothetical protein
VWLSSVARDTDASKALTLDRCLTTILNRGPLSGSRVM